MNEQNSFCERRRRGKLQRETIAIPIAGTAGTYTLSKDVQSGQGDVVGMDLFIPDAVIATVDGWKVNVKSNNTDILIDEPAIRFTPLYGQYQKTRFPMLAKEQQKLSVSVTTDTATATTAYVTLYYGDPAAYASDPN